jgi:hypothetical protein
MSHQPHQHRAANTHPIAGFIDRYGWRAYALPVLSILTVIALFRAGGGHNRADAAGHRATDATPASGSPSARPTATTSVGVRTISLPPDPDAAGRQVNEHTVDGGPTTPCQGNTSAKRVVVSIGHQHAWMCAKSEMVFSTAVTTGAVNRGDATPTGTFHIQGNDKGSTLIGADYAVHVAYWIQFDGDIGFHDASWQTMRFGTDAYRSQGSLGCVHMPLPSIAWLHKWVQIGTTVVTVTKS